MIGTASAGIRWGSDPATVRGFGHRRTWANVTRLGSTVGVRPPLEKARGDTGKDGAVVLPGIPHTAQDLLQATTVAPPLAKAH